MNILAVATAYADKIADELAAEEARIAALVADKQVGDGSGYWKQAHTLRMRLRAARALQIALTEDPKP